MKKYLPSKKLTLIFLGIVAVIVAGFFFFTRKTDGVTREPVKEVPLSAKSIVLQEVVDRDSDKDGIKDWEEALWGTDPNKTDTDGDGVTDFDYITKKKAALAKNNTSEDGTSPINETDVFAQELFTAIISLRESGNLTTATINDLSQQLAQNIGQKKALQSIYVTKDLVVTKPTRENREAYNDKLQALIVKYDNKDLGEELGIFADALSGDDAGLYKKLKDISDAYIAFSKELMQIPMPEDVSIRTLSLANSLQKTGIAVANMSLLKENELIGLIGVGQYGPYSDQSDLDIEQIASYLRRNDILQ